MGENHMNILAISAHPDDMEFCCAGTLLKYKQQGHNVFLALTTSGNQGSSVIKTREEIGAIREAEALESAKLLGAEVRFLRYDDELLLDTLEARRKIINAMRWAQPDVILTHYPDDPSTDHTTTGHIVSKLMLSLMGKLIPADEPPVTKKVSLFYFDNAAGINFLPEAYVDITDTLEIKQQMLAKHKSQVEWMGCFGKDQLQDYLKTIARFRGIQAGCEYAEGFRAFRIFGYMPNFKLLP
jgi:N-acetylglucosamine malate deacetylase 1